MKSLKADCEQRLKGEGNETSTVTPLIASNQEMLTTSKRHTAFTLAEALITLTVIGIVAAMTIPSLINDIEEARFASRFKKAYAEISSVAKLAAFEQNGNLFDTANKFYTFRDYFVPKFNYTKYCVGDQIVGNCWHDPANIVYELDPSAYEESVVSGLNVKGLPPGPSTEFFALVLSNGTLIFNTALVNDAMNSTIRCGSIFSGLLIDINGFKEPNKLGKDIYALGVAENGQVKAFDECVIYVSGKTGAEVNGTSLLSDWLNR